MEVKIMNTNNRKSLSIAALVCGILGCLCYGTGDWLMIFGNTFHTGKLFWLTEGVSQIPAWRNNAAMILAFPGIIFYGTALFGMELLIESEKTKKIYHYLNVFGLTPWMCLHIFYIMILYLYAWMTNNGYSEAALPACEALFQHLSWVVAASEIMMLPVFIFWFFAVISGKTILPKKAAFLNVLFFYLILKISAALMPYTAFRLGFTNALMSESMVLSFAATWTCAFRAKCKGRRK